MTSTSPVHETCTSESAWTTANVGEALPGLLRPMCWTAVRGPLERGLRQGIFDLGGLTRAELDIPKRVDDRLIAVFHGRCAASIDPLRRVSDRIPGTSGDAFERSIFGQVRAGVSSTPDIRRYPIAAAKSTWTATRIARRLETLSRELHPWWLALCVDRSRAGTARELLAEAQAKLEAAFRPHMAVRMLASGLYDRLDGMGAPPGVAGTAVAVVTGRCEEAGLLAVLRQVAAEQCSMETFLRMYGFHGPSEGDLASRPWREDPAPLQPLVKALAIRTDQERVRDQCLAENEFLSHLKPGVRPIARGLVTATRHYTVLGELGKACFLRALDGIRFAVRQRADELTARGILEDPDDVFFLTETEAFDAELTKDGVVALCVQRRQQHAGFATMRLRPSWTGVASSLGNTDDPATAGTDITGVGASSGRPSGRARVIDDPARGEIEAGEILVAEFTDPSWTPLISLAAGLVIDIGGAMSHGAIIARELGVPCVIGTGNAVRRIRTGDLLDIDGSNGVVRVRVVDTGNAIVQ